MRTLRKKGKGGLSRHHQRIANTSASHYNTVYDNSTGNWNVDGITFNRHQGNKHAFYTSNIRGIEVFARMTPSWEWKISVDDDIEDITFGSLLEGLKYLTRKPWNIKVK